MGVGQGPGGDYLMMISPEAALDAYEAARHRLPKVQCGPDAIRHVESLGAIADEFDVFLLDAFGVLNVGEAVVPGAPSSVAKLQSAGKRVLVVSNAASVDTSALVQKYTHLGFAFDQDDIVSSRQTLCGALPKGDKTLWGVVAPDAAVDLGDLGLANMLPLLDDSAAYDACEGVLLMGTGNWSDARQKMLEAALQRRPRPVLVANPDIVAPRENGFSVEPGHVAHQLADATGVVPMFYGKPFANIFDMVFNRLGSVDRSQVLMVGDSLHTDILGAQSYGIKSALIPGFGFFAGGGAEQAIIRTGIKPEFVVTRP